MVDYHYDGDEMVLDKVQLTDFDNVAYLPNGRYVRGLIGNENWRSPEALFKSSVGKPTDIYSFGIVVSVSCHTRVSLC